MRVGRGCYFYEKHNMMRFALKSQIHPHMSMSMKHITPNIIFKFGHYFQTQPT